MFGFLMVLIVIISVLLILIVLIQNPKGGGLGAGFGGTAQKFMSVQKTGDFLEKTTWTLAIALVGISLLTTFFLPKQGVVAPEEQSEVQEQLDQLPATGQPINIPQSDQPAQGNEAGQDSEEQTNP